MEWKAILETAEEPLGGFKLREQLFFSLEFLRVNTTAAATKPDWMFQVKHFVIDDVLDGATRHPRMIEGAAYDNRVVSGIVVPQATAGASAAPSHLRSS